MISLAHRLNPLRRLAAAAFAAILALPAAAQFTVPSDGSDGTLNVTSSDRTIDLSLAREGAWNEAGTGNGVYDKDQWIVVFKYQSVNIAAGRTVRFSANHPANPPVVWLVQGDVTINGSLNLQGHWGWWNPPFSSGGPGGFRGGRRVDYFTAGFGPGAGFAWNSGLSQGQSYQNASCFPLIGGSGSSSQDGNRGGGGGAILIAATGTITINGNINANGGAFMAGGGMIRLVAPTINGTGFLYASEHRTDLNDPQYHGRIRLEANTINFGNPSVPPYSTGTLGTELRFLRDDLTPSARVVSIDDTAVEDDPGTSFSPEAAVTTESRKPRITIECRNVPEASIVKVYFRSANQGGPHTVVNAIKTGGNDALSTWLAVGDLGANEGYATVQARVILPNP